MEGVWKLNKSFTTVILAALIRRIPDGIIEISKEEFDSIADDESCAGVRFILEEKSLKIIEERVH
jgi:hypothetical protein